jgi:exodeoxyribonuclease VII small subunit
MADNTPEQAREPDGGSVPPLSYEQARSELETVVQRLEAGGATLEESLALWERGEYLAGVCAALLDQARHRIERALSERAPATGDTNGEAGGEASA